MTECIEGEHKSLKELFYLVLTEYWIVLTAESPAAEIGDESRIFFALYSFIGIAFLGNHDMFCNVV